MRWIRAVAAMLNSRDIDLLRPDVAANCRKLLAMCMAQGLKVLVTNTVRDREYQEYLYAQGRTRPGSIVTNGRVPTFHWDKAGLAFDVCQNIRGQEYNDGAFFINVATIAKAMGFSWGGDWHSFVDKPHFQWDDHGKYTGKMILAGQLPPEMPGWEEENMGEEQFYGMFLQALARYESERNEKPASSWAKESVGKAKAAGVLDGTMPRAPLTREQMAAVLDRLGLIK